MTASRALVLTCDTDPPASPSQRQVLQQGALESTYGIRLPGRSLAEQRHAGESITSSPLDAPPGGAVVGINVGPH